MQFSPSLNFAGKDNFQWWIGQVTDPTKGKWDKARHKITMEEGGQEIYSYRCRVRILGYHDCANDLPDEKLPLAHVLVPPNAQNGAGEGSTFNYKGGEVVVGFFIDGDDAQQPVVFGSLFKQNFVADTLTNAEYSSRKDVCFQPWTPPGAKQTIKATAKKKARVQQKKLAFQGPENNNTHSDATAVVDKLNDFESTDATPCEDTQISKIREAVERFIKKLNNLQKILDGYVDPILGKIVNLGEDLKATAGIVFDTMTGLIRRARSWVVQQILKKLSGFLKSIVPAPFHKVTGKAIKTIVDLIVCIFEKIIKQLFKYIIDSLENLIGAVIDVPLCAVENFMGDMLGQLYGVIDSQLGPLLSQINNIVGGALGKASSIISKGLQFANLFLSILDCDKMACRPPRKWRNKSGPTNEDIDNFKNILAKASLASIAADKLKNVNDMIKADAIAPDCSTNVLRCGPPRIDFVGGGGSLASGKAVVSAIGNLIGVAIDNSGFGFTSPPLLTFYDSCGNGYGGYGRAIIGPVSETSPGSGVYSPDPNGNETGVTMIEIINEGGGYLPNTTETTLNDDGSTTTTVVVPDQDSNTDSENSYVLEIEDVIVDETGYLYSDGDTVTVLSCDGQTPDTSGAEISLTIIEGYIMKATVLNGGSGFTCLPELVINSDTGVGATLTPVMKFTRVEDAKRIASTTQAAVVTVIDCVQR